MKTSAGKRFRETVVQNICTRFTDIEENEIYSFATMLDPRLKTFGFEYDYNANTAIKKIRTILRNAENVVPEATKETSCKRPADKIEVPASKKFRSDFVGTLQKAIEAKSRDTSVSKQPFQYVNVSQIQLASDSFILQNSFNLISTNASVHIELKPLNQSIGYLFVFKLGFSPIVNSIQTDFDSFKIFCPSKNY